MKVSTFFILLGMLIISFYFLIDVSFYASQMEIENDSNVPIVLVPSIDVTQSVNNKSISHGVYHEPQSMEPGNGTVILFGHRTFYGSPFLRLDQVEKGDTVFLDWPDIGRVEYKVTDSFIVPASYRISVEQGEKLFLITCHPLGSTQERLIVETDLVNIEPLDKTINYDNPQNYNALLMIGGFLAGGLTLTYFYPVKEDKKFLLAATIGLTLFLILSYLFPVPANFISNILIDINNLFNI